MGEASSITHIINTLDGFDFEALPKVGDDRHERKRYKKLSDLSDALSEVLDIESTEIETAILKLAMRAVKSETLDGYEEQIELLCRALASKNLGQSLSELKELSKRDSDIISISACRAILDLEEVNPENRKHPCAIRARNILAEARKEEEFWWEGFMREDEDKGFMEDRWCRARDYAWLLSDILYCPDSIKDIDAICSMCGRRVEFADFKGKRERQGFIRKGLCKECLDMAHTGEVTLGFNEFRDFLKGLSRECKVEIKEVETIRRNKDDTDIRIVEVGLSTFDAVRQVRVRTTVFIGVAHPNQGEEWLEGLRLKAAERVEAFKAEFGEMGFE